MLNMINIYPNFVPGSTGTGAPRYTRRWVPSASIEIKYLMHTSLYIYI